ncbi:MAG TPA: NAD(P)H-hydrate epimerase [bacterium]|nr:NAD(P)H-hydrate epimerase [bacterium]
MKVVTGKTMADLDRRAIQEHGIPSLQLMEKAGYGAMEILLRRFEPCPESRIVIIAGCGNNGGDGFVLARLLQEKGFVPTVWIASTPDRLKGDALENYKRYSAMAKPVSLLTGEKDLDVLADSCACADVIVDALLGTGFRGQVQSPYLEIIETMNKSFAKVLAMDVPSGLNADDGTVSGACVKADVTATMQLPKLGLLVPPGVDFAGDIEVIPLEFPKELLVNDGHSPEFLTERDVASLLPIRERSAHKGTAGHLLILAGSQV